MKIIVATVYDNMTQKMFEEFVAGLKPMMPADIAEDLLKGHAVTFSTVDGELDGQDFVGVTTITRAD